jgi:omega-6 fatty acid desaturase (delta-12 desaturase)
MQQTDHSIYTQLPAIVKRYQLPDSRKATIQILNSFLPFIAIWIAMYVWRDVSIWLTIGLAVWFFYVQHQHEYTYKAWKEKWDYLTASIQGSSYYKLPRFFHWLSGNIGYHHIHHLNSLVPNYELARCHHENPIFDQVANTLTFWESLSCVFNKLWDEDQEKMIGWREYSKLSKKQSKP